MKFLSTLAVAAAIVLSSLAGSAYASIPTEPNSTFNSVPAQCAVQATKAAHPAWFRIGGYCNPFDADSHSN